MGDLPLALGTDVDMVDDFPLLVNPPCRNSAARPTLSEDTVNEEPSWGMCGWWGRGNKVCVNGVGC